MASVPGFRSRVGSRDVRERKRKRGAALHGKGHWPVLDVHQVRAVRRGVLREGGASHDDIGIANQWAFWRFGGRGKKMGGRGPFFGDPSNVRIVVLILVHAVVHAGDNGTAAATAKERTANAGIMVDMLLSVAKKRPDRPLCRCVRLWLLRRLASPGRRRC